MRWIFLFSFFFSVSVSAEIYRWVDENGKVHYGDRKKHDVKQEVVELKTSRSEWKEFDIKVDITSTDVTEEEVAQIKRSVKWVYRFFDEHLHFDIYKTVPVNIRIEPDQKSYLSYVASVSDGDVLHSRGVFIRDLNQIAVFMRKDRDGTFATIKHEVSHAIVKALSPFTPRWLNEGLAEQMETIEEENGVLKIYQHEENIESLRKIKHRMLPLEKFLTLHSGQWKNDYMAPWDMQTYSGGLIYSLLSTTAGRPFVRRLLHYYSRGEKLITRYVVDDFYTGGLEVMEINWRSWIDKGGEPYIEFK